MATGAVKSCSGLTPRQLSLPGRSLPPALPLIISCQDSWNPDSCKLETIQEDRQDHHLKLVEDALELLHSIDKPLAVLSICGPYRSGKSYFLSRLLGNPGAFQLDHSMQACTRGIWMATTILDCEEFATILLDTEGIDAIGASETTAMSLLTLTTLLSSYLIYNSKRVPQKVDLDKMRCFSQLSTSLLAQRGDSITMKKFFPCFLWLLRDVTLAITNKEGKAITPTEYLHTRVLASEYGEPTELGKSLCSLFPSLECSTLPVPSIKPEVIRNIVEQHDKLKPAFNTAVNELIQQILQQVAPKKAIDGITSVSGCTLAALAHGYVNAINTPGALPDLEQGWQAVIRLQLREFSDQLVKEYEKEMEESLRGNLPMEERNLMRIHEQTLNRKKKALRQEICRINPLNSSTKEYIEPLLSQLEEEIIKWSPEENAKIDGGVVFQFTTQNYSKSKEHCEKLFHGLVERSKVQESFTEAVQNSQPLEIISEMETITLEYRTTAVGPAAEEVLEKGLTELNHLRDSLEKIPGSPREVEVIGRGPDRIKLSWEPPEQNPRAAEEYVVSKRIEGGEWEEVKRTKKMKALVTELKSNKKYEFRVIATNPLIRGLETQQCSETRMNKSQNAAKAYVNEGVPTITESFHCFQTAIFSKDESRESRFFSGLLGTMNLALSPIFLPITMPIGAACAISVACKKCIEGDLTPVEEDNMD